jgi:hypothetical protein
MRLTISCNTLDHNQLNEYHNHKMDEEYEDHNQLQNKSTK